MNKEIKKIMISNKTTKQKKNELDLLSEQIKLAKLMLEENFLYCSDCDNFYLAKSFTTETETEDFKICVYKDLMHEDENKYAEGFCHIKYRVCPKGHKHELFRNKLTKSMI